MKSFVARWKAHPRITPAAAPHSGYTCSKETLLAARDFAQREGLPLLTHVAESPKELADAHAKWGKTPVAYLASIGFFDPPPSGPRFCGSSASACAPTLTHSKPTLARRQMRDFMKFLTAD